MTTRSVTRVIRGMETSDGAGVRLRRSLGQGPHARLDPFLMLDEFATDDPGDYIAGFPAHPHRGFETVTYMLDGHMLHEDHLGNRGHLRSGGAQWMTAGRGIIHSEMPQQEQGRMHGFQLWLNLPAREKMKPGSYRDVAPEEIPEVGLPNGARGRILAGRLESGDGAVAGPIQGVSTQPLFVDITVPAGAEVAVPLPPGHSAFVYVYQGKAEVGAAGTTVAIHEAGLLDDGDDVRLVAADGLELRLLLLAARPLHEPVVQYGPFVMNTREEIERALADYQAGLLTD